MRSTFTGVMAVCGNGGAVGVVEPGDARAALGQGQFATEAEAKASCPTDSVVWANLRSKVYHASSSKSYGKTKRGAYMCEKEATSRGSMHRSRRRARSLSHRAEAVLENAPASRIAGSAIAQWRDRRHSLRPTKGRRRTP